MHFKPYFHRMMAALFLALWAAVFVLAVQPAGAEWRPGARLDIVSADTLVFYRGKDSGLQRGVSYEVRLMPFDKTIGAVRIIEITDTFTRAQILDGSFVQYEGEKISFVPVMQKAPDEGPKVLRVPVPEPPPEEPPVIVAPPKPQKPPEPPPPKTLADMPEYAATLERKVKQDRRPRAEIMFRYEKYRDDRELFADDSFLTLLSFSRPYEKRYTGSVYFGYRTDLGGGDSKGRTYGVSFSRLYPDLEMLTLAVARTEEDYEYDWFIDSDYTEMLYSLTWSKTMVARENYNYGYSLAYAARTQDVEDQDIYFRFNYNFFMNNNYFGSVSYIHSFSVDMGESLTNQYIFALGRDVSRLSRLTAEYVKVDSLYDDRITFANRNDESSWRLSLSHLF